MANALLHARQDKGMTQEQVASVAGIDRTVYSRIERGIRKPDVVTALRIAEALNKTVEDIFLSNDVLKKHEDQLKTLNHAKTKLASSVANAV